VSIPDRCNPDDRRKARLPSPGRCDRLHIDEMRDEMGEVTRAASPTALGSWCHRSHSAGAAAEPTETDEVAGAPRAPAQLPGAAIPHPAGPRRLPLPDPGGGRASVEACGREQNVLRDIFPAFGIADDEGYRH
jgi:hypothetical protein